ncbi:MAG: DUF4038 domain-containing protein [Mangrovibacterium sp.]|nr:DUF4038 domain-containing protein [Mangrovibacterium sp.]
MNINKIVFAASILLLSVVFSCNGQEGSPSDNSFCPLDLLRPSANGRYLVDKNNRPVYLLGGTAWTMPENCTREDVDDYLQDRKNKGFNYVQIVATRDLHSQGIEDQVKKGTMNPENKYGFRPFSWNENQKADVSNPVIVKGGTPTEPNDYWDHLEYIIQKTESLGMYVGLLPTWGKYYINNKIPEMRLFTEASAYTYGQFLGERYRKYNHIIWILGGDVPAIANVDGRPIYRKMAEGIAKGATREELQWDKASPSWEKIMVTYHGRNAASEFFETDAWLRLNMVYNDDPELHGNILHYYHNGIPRPMLQGECWYEGWVWNGTHKPAKVIRRQMYQTFFSGALAGYVYGVAASTRETTDMLLKFMPGWKDRLNLEGAGQVKYLKKLLDQHKWWNWEPAQNVILDGLGEGETLKTACASTNGRELLIYFADTVPATINLKRITASPRATVNWYDPRNGNTLNAGIYETCQAKSFSPPDNWDDSVLIIEAKD